MLASEPDIRVQGMAASAKEAIHLIENERPDVVLMDLKMPGMNGVEATRQIHLKHPQIKIIVLTTYENDTWLFEALRVGATSYILKGSSRDELVRALRGTFVSMFQTIP